MQKLINHLISCTSIKFINNILLISYRTLHLNQSKLVSKLRREKFQPHSQYNRKMIVWHFCLNHFGLYCWCWWNFSSLQKMQRIMNAKSLISFKCVIFNLRCTKYQVVHRCKIQLTHKIIDKDALHIIETRKY